MILKFLFGVLLVFPGALSAGYFSCTVDEQPLTLKMVSDRLTLEDSKQAVLFTFKEGMPADDSISNISYAARVTESDHETIKISFTDGRVFDWLHAGPIDGCWVGNGTFTNITFNKKALGGYSGEISHIKRIEVDPRDKHCELPKIEPDAAKAITCIPSTK